MWCAGCALPLSLALLEEEVREFGGEGVHRDLQLVLQRYSIHVYHYISYHSHSAVYCMAQHVQLQTYTLLSKS